MLGDCWTHSWYNKTDGKNLTSPQDNVMASTCKLCHQKRTNDVSTDDKNKSWSIRTKWLKKEIFQFNPGWVFSSPSPTARYIY